MTTTAAHKTSILTAALEQAWDDIRARHDEIPEVVIVVGPTSMGRGRSDRYGHFAQRRWAVGTERRHEVLISAEGLDRGARQVFRTLLHESVHASCCARGLQDTSRGGSYHNGTFRAEAEAFGCVCEKNSQIGTTTPDITDEAAAEYAESIARIDVALTLFRREDMADLEDLLQWGEVVARIMAAWFHDASYLAMLGRVATFIPPAAPRRRGHGSVSGRNPSKASCGCRSIRVQASVLAEGPITCGNCGERFVIPE